MMRARLCAAVMLGVAGCSDPTGPETEISGRALYDQYCARCHATDGSGVAEVPSVKSRLDDPRVMKNFSDERLEDSIRAGKPPNMPGFADQFSEAKLKVLVAYVRTLSGTQGSRKRP